MITQSPSPAITSISEARLTRAAARKPAVHIDQLWRDEIRTRDWGKVHVEGDRREPIVIQVLRKVHRL